jgi:hypothetical protein
MAERPEFIRDMFGRKIGRLDVLKGKYFYGAAEAKAYSITNRRPVNCKFCKKKFTPNIGHNRFCCKECQITYAKLLRIRKKIKYIQRLSYDITLLQRCEYDKDL